MICDFVQVADQMPLLSSEALSMLLVGVVLPMTLVFLVSFVPAIIELERPRDAGPRLIVGTSIDLHRNLVLLDVEANVAVKLVPKLSTVFPVPLANLETFT